MPLYDPDVAATLRGSTLSLFRQLTNWRALLDAVGEVLQGYMDLVFDVYVSAPLDVATGNDLVVWGRTVGVEQGDLSDAEFRRVIKLRVEALISQGTARTILALYATGLGVDLADVEASDIGNATFDIAGLVRSIPSDRLREETRRAINLAKMAGIQYFATFGTTDAFAFDDPDKGFDGATEFAYVL